MRLLYCITKAEHGGAQAHVRDLMAAFRRNYEVSLAVGEEGFLTDEARRLGIEWHRLEHLVQPMSPTKDAKAIGELTRLLRSERFDLVHAHSSKAGVVARVAGARTRTPVVFTAHGWAFTDGVSRKRAAIATMTEKLVAPLSARIITVSEQDRRLALDRRVASSRRLVTIQNGVADVGARAAPGGDETPRIIVVARFSPQKAQDLLLRALAPIKEPWRAAFVGDGPLIGEARTLASELGIEDRVEFRGALDDVTPLLAASHLFCLPSNWEGLPLSILEAMRVGLPVVATDVGGVAEAITHGETGYLVPRGDERTLEGALRKLVVDPALRERLGQAGRKRFEERFLIERMLAETQRVYEEALAGGPTGTGRAVMAIEAEA